MQKYFKIDMPTMRLMLRKNTKSSCLCSISFMIALAMTMMVFTTATGFTNLTALAQQKKQVTLTAMLPDNSGGNPTEDQKERLFQPAMQELRTRHPNLYLHF